QLSALQNHLLDASRAKMSAIERKAYHNLRKAMFLVRTATRQNIVPRTPELLRLSYRNYRLVSRTSFVASYAWFIVTILFDGFPGGFYGCLAFLFLTSVCAIKLIQIYLQ